MVEVGAWGVVLVLLQSWPIFPGSSSYFSDQVCLLSIPVSCLSQLPSSQDPLLSCLSGPPVLSAAAYPGHTLLPGLLRNSALAPS